MTSRHIYPRGFEVTTDSPVPSIRRNDGDDEVEFLYQIFINREESYDSWEFRRKVFFLAKRLIGRDIGGWLNRHLKSTYLHHNARAFIADTFRFIETGHRHVGMRNWLDLLETNPKAIPTPIVSSGLHLPECLVGNTSHYLNQWLRHEGGFRDLLTSLLIMYGPGMPSTRAVIGVGHISPKNPKLQALTEAITRNVEPPEEYK